MGTALLRARSASGMGNAPTEGGGKSSRSQFATVKLEVTICVIQW